MKLFYPLIRYFNHLSDGKFIIRYEQLVLHHMKRFFWVIFGIYVLVVGLIGMLIGITNNTFTIVVVVMLFGLFFGGFVIKETVEFLTVYNTKYMEVKMRQGDPIDYNNVVN